MDNSDGASGESRFDWPSASAEIRGTGSWSPKRHAFVGAVALLSICVVAAASARLPLRLPGRIVSPPGARPGVVEAVLLAAVVVAFVGFAYVAWVDRAPEGSRSEPGMLKEEEPQRVVDWASVLLLPLLFMSVVALGLAIGWLFDHPAADGGGAGRPKAFRVPGAAPAGGSGDAVPVDWLVFAVIAGVAGVVACVLLGRGWRHRRRARRGASRELVAALDESLEDLEREADPRAAVIRAYARMERSLAVHGAGRRLPETPLEYLGRVLLAVQASQGSATLLTALFQQAEFSSHVIDAAMKREAIAALRDLRDELASAGHARAAW